MKADEQTWHLLMLRSLWSWNSHVFHAETHHGVGLEINKSSWTHDSDMVVHLQVGRSLLVKSFQITTYVCHQYPTRFRESIPLSSVAVTSYWVPIILHEYYIHVLTITNTDNSIHQLDYINLSRSWYSSTHETPSSISIPLIVTMVYLLQNSCCWTNPQSFAG